MVELFKIILGIVTITSLNLDLKGNCTGQRAYKMKKNKKTRSEACLVLEILTTLVFYCGVISGKKTFAYANPYINMKYYKAVVFLPNWPNSIKNGIMNNLSMLNSKMRSNFRNYLNLFFYCQFFCSIVKNPLFLINLLKHCQIL